MADIYTTLLTDDEIRKIKEMLNQKSNNIGNCIIWTGETIQDGYGVLRHTIRHKRLKLRVHRILFYVLTQCAPIYSQLQHVSHLCNQKLCLRFEHLSLEPAVVNNQRKTCFAAGICFGHDTYPRCALRYANCLQFAFASIVSFFIYIH